MKPDVCVTSVLGSDPAKALAEMCFSPTQTSLWFFNKHGSIPAPRTLCCSSDTVLKLSSVPTFLQQRGNYFLLLSLLPAIAWLGPLFRGVPRLENLGLGPVAED